MSSYDADARKPRPSLRRTLRGLRWRAGAFWRRDILHRPKMFLVDVDERVAFHDDHSEYGGMYGIVKAKTLVDGLPVFDLLVYDPADKHVLSADTRRTTMEEIQ